MNNRFLALFLIFAIVPVIAAAGNMIPSGISGASAIGVLEPPPIPAGNPQTPAKIALGKKLFFDPDLSGSGKISCATCHDPQKGWGDGQSFPPVGVSKLGRNTPHLYNTAWQVRWFWDGRADSLEEQALSPIRAGNEMGQTLDKLIKVLSANPVYRREFAEVFGHEGISGKTISQAIAAYERTIVSRGSAFEKYLRGDQQAISQSAKRGLDLFVGKARCIICHNGPNLTDNGFHNIGVPATDWTIEDVGHYQVVSVRSQRGAFKTPSLHSTALTAPYMHNGSLPTLESVISFYDKGGEVKENLDPQIKALHLTESERSDLLAFLEALTGED